MQSPHLEIKKIHVQHESDDNFGRVSSCYVEVMAQLRSAMVTSRRRISANGVDLTWELRTKSNVLLGTAFMDADDLSDGSAHVDCVLLDKTGKRQALLLERVSEGNTAYFRIGCAELLGLDEEDDFFADGSESLIRLV